MYIKDLLDNFRKNRTKLKRMTEVKSYYISMYRTYMVKLYDMNYIDDPTKFNENLIIKNIVELGINDFFTYTGKVDLSSEHALFALYKNKEDAEKKEFLECLYNVLKYREYSTKVDNIYEEFGYRDSVSNTIRIAMYPKGASIVQRSGLVFDEAMARCISSFEEDTKCVCINDRIWGIAMELLEIPKEDWYTDGIFDEKLTHSEEVECMEGILNGTYKITKGKYQKRLHKWLSSHIWDSDPSYKLDSVGLFDYIFSSKVKEVEAIINKVLTGIDTSEDCTVLAIQKNRIYYNKPRTSIELPFGIFAVVCDARCEEYMLPNFNVVNGYTGELYSFERLLEDDIDYVGCPVTLNISNTETDLFYDLEQTSIVSKTWFENVEDISIVFDKTIKENNPFKKGTLEWNLFEGYVNSLRSSDTLTRVVSVSDLKTLNKAKKDVFKKIGG